MYYLKFSTYKNAELMEVDELSVIKRLKEEFSFNKIKKMDEYLEFKSRLKMEDQELTAVKVYVYDKYDNNVTENIFDSEFFED